MIEGCYLLSSEIYLGFSCDWWIDLGLELFELDGVLERIDSSFCEKIGIQIVQIDLGFGIGIGWSIEKYYDTDPHGMNRIYNLKLTMT